MKQAEFNYETIYNFLIDQELFNEEEISLCVTGWGDNLETYNTMCQVRYAMDVNQVAEECNCYIDELNDYQEIQYLNRGL